MSECPACRGGFPLEHAACKACGRKRRIEIVIEDGYPTEDSVKALEAEGIGMSPEEALELVRHTLPDAFEEMGYGSVERLSNSTRWHKEHKYERIVLHTGGWSGCEALIHTALEHFFVAHWLVEWHTGGHWYFEVPSE